MKHIDTQGIGCLNWLEGSSAWYWGTDYTSGDLYEAEELFRMGHRIKENRLILVHYPDGQVHEPIPPREGQYFGLPLCFERQIILLLVDFPAGMILLRRYDAAAGAVLPIADIPLAEAEDCYNLMPHAAPLCLTRQAHDRFEILWPEKTAFSIGPRESFVFREGNRLYFSEWQEDPDYREEVLVRSLSGALLERYPGSMRTMPNGETWLLR